MWVAWRSKLGIRPGPIVDLLRVLDEGGDLATVPALLYREDGEVKRTAKLPINRGLDELPMPAWDLLEDFPGAYLPAAFDFPRGPVATIAASRGGLRFRRAGVSLAIAPVSWGEGLT